MKECHQPADPGSSVNSKQDKYEEKQVYIIAKLLKTEN